MVPPPIRGLSVFLLAFLLTAPVVAAQRDYPVQGVVDSYGPADFHATLNASLQLSAIHFESSWKGGNPVAGIHVAAAHVLVLDWPLLRVTSEEGSPLGPGAIYDQPQQQPSVIDDEYYTGSIRLSANRPDAEIRFLPAVQGSTFPATLNFTGASTIAPPFDYGSALLLFSPYFQERQMVPDGSPGRLRGDPADALSITAPLLTFAYGTNVTFLSSSGPRSWQTGEFPRGGVTASDPLHYTQSGYYDRIYVVILSDSTHIALPHAGLDSWWFSVHDMSAHIAGDLAFTAVDPHTSVDHQFLNQSLGLLQLKGAFALESAYASGHGHSSLDGHAWFVAADGVTVVGSRFPAWTAVAVVGGLGLLFLSVILALRKGVLGFILGYTRADPLGNRTRIEMLQAVAAQPGLTTAQLQKRLGVWKTTVSFHGKVLVASGCIEMRRVGNRHHYWPNGGSMNFPAPQYTAGPGVATPHAGIAASALTHPLRALIVDTVNRLGGSATFNGMQRCWQTQHPDRLPSRRLITYHAHVLTRLGILTAARHGAETQWTSLVDHEEIFRIHRARASSSQEKDRLLQFIAADGPTTENHVIAALASSLKRPDVRTMLIELVASGHLGYQPGRKRYFATASPHDADLAGEK